MTVKISVCELGVFVYGSACVCVRFSCGAEVCTCFLLCCVVVVWVVRCLRLILFFVAYLSYCFRGACSFLLAFVADLHVFIPLF